MTSNSFHLNCISGIKLFAQEWLPKENPKAIIILIHGMGEHSSRYEHVAQFFTDNGFIFMSCDRSGHGKSEGKRGHIAKYEFVLEEVKRLQQRALSKYPQLPVFLYGHSMGGGIVLNYAIRNPKSGFKAIVASAPLLKLAFEPPAFKIFLGKMMKNIYPGFSQENEINPNHISRDPAEVEKYKKDTLNHNRITAETAMGLLSWGDYALAHASELDIPTLLIHGSSDQLTSHQGTIQFHEKSKRNSEIILYEGLYHELHNEPEKEKVLNDVLFFLNKHL